MGATSLTQPTLTELADFTDLQSSLTLTPGVTLDLYDQMGTWNYYLFIVTSYSLYFLSFNFFFFNFLAIYIHYVELGHLLHLLFSLYSMTGVRELYDRRRTKLTQLSSRWVKKECQTEYDASEAYRYYIVHNLSI